MSDVLGPGAYGDPENPALTRADYNAEHHIDDDPFLPSKDAPAPASTSEENPDEATPVAPPAEAPVTPDVAPEAPTTDAEDTH